MVVFPAPSSPRMRILISRVPNKLEKMVEKKPPTKTRRERHFNVSQLSGRYADWPHFLLAYKMFPFSSEKGQVHVVAQMAVCSTAACPPGLCCHFMIYGSSLQQITLQQHQISLQLPFYFFLFSHLPKYESSSFWLVSDSTFSVPETIQRPKEAWKNSESEDVYGLPQDHPLLFFLKLGINQ